MKLLLLVAGAILLGSVPFGVVIARARGIDLKRVGSGNIGATNVLRTMGKTPALLTLAGDVLKGAIPVLAAKYLTNDPAMEGIVGLAVILGHNFSLFLRFRGGKGVATSIGVLLIYSPYAAVITVLIWLTVLFATRYSSLAAIVSFGLLPISLSLVDYTKEKMIVSCMITALLMIRHVDNINRLIRGKEPRIGKRA